MNLARTAVRQSKTSVPNTVIVACSKVRRTPGVSQDTVVGEDCRLVFQTFRGGGRRLKLLGYVEEVVLRREA